MRHVLPTPGTAPKKQRRAAAPKKQTPPSGLLSETLNFSLAAICIVGKFFVESFEGSRWPGYVLVSRCRVSAKVIAETHVLRTEYGHRGCGKRARQIPWLQEPPSADSLLVADVSDVFLFLFVHANRLHNRRSWWVWGGGGLQSPTVEAHHAQTLPLRRLAHPITAEKLHQSTVSAPSVLPYTRKGVERHIFRCQQTEASRNMVSRE